MPNYQSSQYYDKHSRNKERDRFYHSSAWKKARELALIRDKYLCQRCLKNKQIVTADMVHHIVEVKDDITKALQLDNLESLCHTCHNKEHKTTEPTRERTKLKVKTFKPNKEIF